MKNLGNMDGNFKVVMIVHFGTKLYFLLFCNPWFEREERWLLYFSGKEKKKKKTLVDTNSNYQNDWSWCQWVSFDKRNFI